MGAAEPGMPKRMTRVWELPCGVLITQATKTTAQPDQVVSKLKKRAMTGP
jgi:hypothetical protein